LLETDGFCFWKTRFETYVRSKDLDLWEIIQNGNFEFMVEDSETKLLVKKPHLSLNDDERKNLGKNDEAKMLIYNALPRREFERVHVCKTANEIWHSLIITHQGNSQVKDCMIDLLIQQYEKFLISYEETIDNGYTRFNAIITSHTALDPSFYNKNHVRKFLRALPVKWRPKVIAIEEGKNLAELPLDELIGNLKFYEMILENDKASTKDKNEKVKSLALKAKVTSAQASDDSDSQDDSNEEDDMNDEEYNLMAKNFQRFFRKGGNFGRRNRFRNRNNDGRNNFGGNQSSDNKVGESSRCTQGCYNCG
jgi:hypothetical protein